MKLRQKLLLALGVSLFVYFTTRAGWHAILNEICKLKWNFIPLLTVYGFVNCWDTLGWRFAFHPRVCCVNFFRLFWIRIAGEAVNNTTPTGYVGGEPVKAMLLKPYGISMTESMSSLVIAKTTMALSQLLFVVIGLVFAYNRLDISNALRGVVLACFGLLIILVFLFLFLQSRGLFSGSAKFFIHLKIGRTFLTNIMHKIVEMESLMMTFYKEYKIRFLISFFFHFLGWLAGIFEIFLIVHWLKLPLDLGDALMIEALHQLIRGLAFMVPANLGTQEGGNLFIFTSLGFGGALGLSVSLIRRVRELFWSGLGWVIIMNSKVNAGKKQ
ncbi:MAG: flippase-like domain-containing protein [Chlamydiae bacterium]|nr:flippase-like domain-containing protein [Chlamydiota bacterium]MBI3277265.1 flippase-like domain-containing protein [Chlamydiota bacterium]